MDSALDSEEKSQRGHDTAPPACSSSSLSEAHAICKIPTIPMHTNEEYDHHLPCRLSLSLTEEEPDHHSSNRSLGDALSSQSNGVSSDYGVHSGKGLTVKMDDRGSGNLEAETNSSSPRGQAETTSESWFVDVGETDCNDNNINLSEFDKFFPEWMEKSAFSEGQSSLCSPPSVAAELCMENSTLPEGAVDSNPSLDDGSATSCTTPVHVSTLQHDHQLLSSKCFAQENSPDLPLMPGDHLNLPFPPLPPAKMLLADILGEESSHSCSFSEVLFPSTPLPYPEPFGRKITSIESNQLILSDARRIVKIHHLTPKVVYDIDALVKEALLVQDASTSQEHALTQPHHEAADSIHPLADALDTVDWESGTLTDDTLRINTETVLPANLDVDNEDDDVGSSVAQCCSSQHSLTERKEPDKQVSLVPLLVFMATSESCNLRKAIQIRETEYDLILNSDINTDHHHQWFLFQVSEMEAGVPYRFNIINCEKPKSQFNEGMQPVLYSTINKCWMRSGSCILYYRNKFSGMNSVPKKVYYTLTFTITFPSMGDVCYLGYHYPYTYSMLRRDLLHMEEKISSCSTVTYYRQNLCQTLGGNICPLITITGRQSEGTRRGEQNEMEGTKESANLKEDVVDLEDKHYVVLTGRVHPGESNSSWVMKGVLSYLVSNDPEAQRLRDKFVFKIVPMLNPDGVINGSHRCSLSGKDLNRQWIEPSQSLFPTVYHTKGLMAWLQARNKSPFVYCDFHGHSRRKNIFMYGCKGAGNSRAQEELPTILDEIAPLFNLANCHYIVEKSKESTARVAVWRRFGVARSYTLESTYCGADQGPYQGLQISVQHLEEMGKSFCTGLLKLAEDPPLLPEQSTTDSASIRKKSGKKSQVKATDNHQAISDCEKEESDLGSSISLEESGTGSADE